ncbi:MAG: hypothetical protein HC818_01960 [Synechococcaceae cyanobacterium RM1_1_27]|nr:hypothetical protein [Synechococcaceae cyanobacterium SM2_3_2]NJO85582.1 hypothetical protein [Synechococcaceae cyanobacterium RM1_1_27]
MGGIPFEQFLELVGRVRIPGMELISGREKNYNVAGRRVGSLTFHG